MQTLNFDEYLSLIKGKPDLARNAHQRAYDAIMKKGYKVISYEKDPQLAYVLGLKSGEKVTLYNIFKEFYGIERELQKIVGYFRAASLGGESSRQILMLLGPPGSGKSDIVRQLYWAMDGEPLFCLEGCPIREDPLNAIPRSEKKKMEQFLGIQLFEEASLCPICRMQFQKSGGDYHKLKVFEDKVSIADGRYFASVDPTEIVSYDRSKYLGSVKIGESESDPLALEWNGAYHFGNRGYVEFVELPKNDKEVHWHLLEATQSKKIESPGKTEKVFIDSVLVAHSNEPEFEKFKKDPINQALVDRMFVVKIPHNIRLSEQIKIVEKLERIESIGKPPYHLAPKTIFVIASLIVLSRLKEAENKKPEIFDRMKIYNGEMIGQNDYPSPARLRMQFPEDGLYGLSNREAAKILEEAIGLVPPNEPLCIDPTLILQIAENIPNFDYVDIHYWSEVREQFFNIAEDCKEYCIDAYKRYLEALKKIKKGMTLDEEEKKLVNNTEKEIDSKDQEELRKIISQNPHYEKTSEAIKTGVKHHVYENFVKSKVSKILVYLANNLSEEEESWKKYLHSRFKALGYCPQCLQRIARWIIG